MNFTVVGAILAMASFTFVLMPITAFARVQAAKAGKIKPSQFKLMNLDGAPDFVVRTTRHWANLYEVPVVFYALTLLCLNLQLQDNVFGALAWAYVVTRLAHATIHISYNKVFHRFLAFLISNIILGIFFVRLIFKVNLI